jgi:hypothetical protein
VLAKDSLARQLLSHFKILLLYQYQSTNTDTFPSTKVQILTPVTSAQARRPRGAAGGGGRLRGRQGGCHALGGWGKLRGRELRGRELRGLYMYVGNIYRYTYIYIHAYIYIYIYI